jgi:hypothetical protein
VYPFLQETIRREQIVESDNGLIDRSHAALRKSWALLAHPRPDSFLGRRNLIEPPPMEYE